MFFHVGPSIVPGVGWNTFQDDLASELKMKHPKPLQGTGKLKDFKLHLHVDPNVPPVALKLRRVSFALREKVSAKIDELRREDNIERLEGPTTVGESRCCSTQAFRRNKTLRGHASR